MQATSLVPGQKHGVLDVLGPTVEFILAPDEPGAPYSILKGTVAPGVAVPIHTHVDLETFTVLAGTLEALTEVGSELTWLSLGPGESLHVPSNTKHAWRNTGILPAQVVITTSPEIGRFFIEAGRPVNPSLPPLPPTPADVQRFVDIALRYGHWIGSPEENAAVGIQLGGAAE